jgi:hypothetical protein
VYAIIQKGEEGLYATFGDMIWHLNYNASACTPIEWYYICDTLIFNTIADRTFFSKFVTTNASPNSINECVVKLIQCEVDMHEQHTRLNIQKQTFEQNAVVVDKHIKQLKLKTIIYHKDKREHVLKTNNVQSRINKWVQTYICTPTVFAIISKFNHNEHDTLKTFVVKTGYLYSACSPIEWCFICDWLKFTSRMDLLCLSKFAMATSI